MRRRGARAAALLLLAASPASAQDAARVAVWVNGVFDAGSRNWTQARSFIEFLEPARYAAGYGADPAAGFDAGIQVPLLSGFGPTLALSRVERDASAVLEASIPHPLYFDRDRSASVDLAGYGISERVIHAGVGWQRSGSALGVAVFGGVSLFRVDADAFDTVQYDQSFPFDSISLRPPAPVERTSNATGFHVGGRLDWLIGSGFGIGAQLRFSGATAEFSLPSGESFEVDAGGLQVGAGLRIYF